MLYNNVYSILKFIDIITCLSCDMYNNSVHVPYLKMVPSLFNWSTCLLITFPDLVLTWYDTGPVIFTTVTGIHFCVPE